MRWDKYTLGYDDESNKRSNTNQKAIPERFLYSDVFWGFEVSPGDRPAEPIIAHKYAPTVREVTTKSYFKKNIIIPTGTIISAAPVLASESYLLSDWQGMGVASGEVGSGELALGIGYDSNTLTTDINDGFEGYDRLRIVAMIANGGTLVKDDMHASDITLGRVDDGGAVVTSSTKFTRPANIPFGFVTEDIFIFDEGGKLNYAQGKWEKYSSFATDYFVEMPYIISDTGSADEWEMLVTESSGVQTKAAGYAAAHALGMPFLTANNLDDMLCGQFVVPDFNGKYKLQWTAAEAFTTATSVKTLQTVGKLISWTNKFPMDLEGLVETYHTTKTGGTATYGLEYRLYVMVRAILTAVLGHAPTYTEIKDAINSAKFGIARVNLHTS